MHSRIQKWGNSLAVRIPKAYAAQAALAENDAVELSIDGREITLRPAAREWTLEELVRGITARNRHREHEWGPVIGREML
ncbi:MAG: AbrB/MazE/SpoVT family DNA-binding domain-containing protein [Candidatus Hydrogenedentales bacterium]